MAEVSRVMKAVQEWDAAHVDIESVDWDGRPLTIHNVPCKINKETGKIRYKTEDLVKAEITQLANNVGIEERDIPLLLMLFAPQEPFPGGYICQKYKLNKMLFYQWKELERVDLGEAILHDEFIAETRGPVPKSLWDDLERLSEEGIVTVEGGGEDKGKKTVVVNITPIGEEKGRELWAKIPPPYKEVTIEVKRRLFPLNPTTIKDQVHRDYPEFKKNYTNLDKEDYIQFKSHNKAVGRA